MTRYPYRGSLPISMSLRRYGESDLPTARVVEQFIEAFGAYVFHNCLPDGSSAEMTVDHVIVYGDLVILVEYRDWSDRSLSSIVMQPSATFGGSAIHAYSEVGTEGQAEVTMNAMIAQWSEVFPHHVVRGIVVINTDAYMAEPPDDRTFDIVRLEDGIAPTLASVIAIDHPHQAPELNRRTRQPFLHLVTGPDEAPVVDQEQHRQKRSVPESRQRAERKAGTFAVRGLVALFLALAVAFVSVRFPMIAPFGLVTLAVSAWSARSARALRMWMHWIGWAGFIVALIGLTLSAVGFVRALSFLDLSIPV